jgi:hypothetical protein
VKPIAEIEFDLSHGSAKMAARVFAPETESGGVWFCRFTVDEPMNVDRKVYGISSMQALFLGLKTLSAYLYGSDFYKNGEIGIHGEFGGDLSIPASHLFLEKSPYPF